MRGLAVTAQPPSLEAARSAVRSGAVYGIVHIPAHWERDRLRNAPQPVVLYDNAQFSLVAGIIGGDVRAAVTSVAVERLVASEARFGGGLAQAAMRLNGVQADLRTLFNPSLSYEAYFAGMLLPPALCSQASAVRSRNSRPSAETAAMTQNRCSATGSSMPAK